MGVGIGRKCNDAPHGRALTESVSELVQLRLLGIGGEHDDTPRIVALAIKHGMDPLRHFGRNKRTDIAKHLLEVLLAFIKGQIGTAADLAAEPADTQHVRQVGRKQPVHAGAFARNLFSILHLVIVCFHILYALNSFFFRK